MQNVYISGETKLKSANTVLGLLVRGLVFLVPLFFLPVTADFFNLNKLALLVVVSFVAVASWGVANLRQRHFSFRTNPMDIPAVLLVVGFLLSAYFATQNKLDAFVFPGVATVVFSSVIFYFVVVQFVAGYGDEGADNRFSSIVGAWVSGVIVASVVSLLSAVGLFGLLGKVMPLPAWLVSSSYFSTVGGVIPSILLFIVSAPLVFGRVMQAMYRAERTGGLSVSTVAYFGGFVIFVASLAFGVYQALPGKVAEYRTLPFSSGWSIALETLKRQPFFGVGVGDFQEAFNRFRPVEYNMGSSWNLAYGASTNWYLNIFTTIGLFGFAIFVLLVLRARIVARQTTGGGDVPYVKVALFAFLIVFLFAPSNLTLIFFFFVLLGLLGSKVSRNVTLQFSVLGEQIEHGEGKRGTNLAALIITILALVGMGGVFFVGGKIYLADVSYRRALNAVATGGKYKDVMDNLVSAITRNPRADFYRTDYARVSLALMQEIARREELSDADKNDISRLIQLAIEQGKAGVALNPVKAANWATLAQIYRAIMPIVAEADEFAVQVYQQAILLESTNPNLRIALGGVFYSLKNYDEAIKSFELAVVAKPDLANAHYNLAVALRDSGKIERSALELQQTMTLVDPGSQDYELVKKELDALAPQLEARARQATASAQVARGEGEQAPLQAPQPAPSPIVTPKLTLPEDSAPPEGEVVNPQQ